MIAIKRKCAFFNSCEYADPTSVMCTQEGGGDYLRRIKEVRKRRERAHLSAATQLVVKRR